MANFTLSTSSLTGGGGTVTVTPVPSTVFTGRKATGTLTVKNGIATKTVSLTKEYPLIDRITKVTAGGTNVSDWTDFEIPASSTSIVITLVCNKPTINLTAGDIDLTGSIKIGSKWYNTNGTESSTLVSFAVTTGGIDITFPNNLGLTAAYTAEITITVPANSNSYQRHTGINVNDELLDAYQDGTTATINVTPTSLSWSSSDTAGKTATVTSNGATIPVTVA